MKNLLKLGTIAFSLMAISCSSVELSKSGSEVLIVESVEKGCKPLGMVFGEGGSSWKGGAWYKNSTLLEYAQNDLKNKAAEKGATHVVTKTSNFGHRSGQYGGTVTGANISGNAYKCKDQSKVSSL